MISERGHKAQPPIPGRPGAAPANNLEEVRAQAAKWAAYTQVRMDGRVPAFSR